MAGRNSGEKRNPLERLRRRAEELLRTKPTETPTMLAQDVQSLLHELNVHQMELEVQNEELRQAQVELSRARDRYADLYEFAPVGYVSLDETGRILEANLTVTKMLNVERQNLVGANLNRFLTPESQDDFYLHRRAVFSSEITQTCEVAFRKTDQRPWAARLESIAFETESGCCCRTAVIDITEQSRVHDLLRKLNIELGQSLVDRTSELEQSIDQVRLLSEAVANLGEGVVITDDELDWPGPRIRFVNEAMCRITGYSADELIGKTPRLLQGKDTDRGVLNQIKADLSAKRPCVVELVNYRKDGTPYDAELFITALFDAEGRRTNFVSIHRDITERKQAERALRESEERFRAFTHATSDVVYAMSPDWSEMRHLEGRGFIVDTREPIRKWLAKYIPADDQPFVMEAIQQAIQTTGVFELEHRVIRVDGTLGWTYSRAIPIFADQGNVVEWFGAAADVTPRKEAEAALKEREERLRAVLNAAADAIITIDQQGQMVDVNPATEQIFGFSREELLGRNVKMLMPPPFRDEHDQYLRRYLDTGEARIIGFGREVIGRRKDGSVFPADLTLSDVGHLGLFTGMVRDISARRVLEKQVLEAAAEESRRIGYELHDNIQQQLTGLGLFASTLAEQLEQESDPKTSTAKRLANGIQQAAEQVHLLSRGLVPVEIEGEGLRSALEELATRVSQQYDVNCEFHTAESVKVNDNFLATHLYRIVQEAINNAVKHGRAERIQISFREIDEGFILTILDNGTGMSNIQLKDSGMGLQIMNYRASLIGAKLDITPGKHGGTLVSCTVLRGGLSHDENQTQHKRHDETNRRGR